MNRVEKGGATKAAQSIGSSGVFSWSKYLAEFVGRPILNPQK